VIPSTPGRRRNGLLGGLEDVLARCDEHGSRSHGESRISVHKSLHSSTRCDKSLLRSDATSDPQKGDADP
jgi:hypothetical protein